MTKRIGDRISVEDQNGATTIVIRPLRVWWKEILLTIWVAGFTFVGLFMIYMLASGFAGLNYDGAPTEDQVNNQFIYGIVFLGFWSYFEYKTLKSLLWYRFGKELILIDNDGFSLKKSILSYGKANRYFFENMKEFHQTKEEPTSFGNFFENAYWSLGTDALVFTYNKKGKSFGRRVDRKNGKLLLDLIDDRVKKRLKKRKK
jgi:hypothetical protein